MGQRLKVLVAVGFSISATLLGMLIMSQFPGLDIPGPYWAFGVLCPALISAPISTILVRQAEANRRLNAQLLAAQALLQHQADHDHLTGALGRAAFWREAGALPDGAVACLMVADIDHFKQINDSHGHAAGDRALCMVAQTLAAAVREDDLISRIGGEEFALLLRDMPPALGLQLAERARAAIAGLALTGAGEQAIAVSVSIGIAAYVPGTPLDAALARADAAMYRAKHLGRNKVLLAA